MNTNDDEVYPFVVKVSYEDGARYYNGAHFMLVVNPSEASRYKTEEAATKNVEYASCQGGVGSVENFKTELTLYKASI